MARCECAGCGEKFGGVEAFDQHQQPAGTCHPPASRGLVLAANGRWGGKPMDEDALSRLGRRPQALVQAPPGVIPCPRPEEAADSRAGLL